MTKRETLLSFIVDNEGNCQSKNQAIDSKMSKFVAKITKEFENFCYEIENTTGLETFPQEGWIFVGKKSVVITKNGGYQVEILKEIPKELKEIMK
ncbi:MAG: hypothetical protein GYA35_07825 [Thermoanaerobaculaceae bacterium]|nr:hypothetical protein [Thermoanaerobaculaceae bacterium]